MARLTRDPVIPDYLAPHWKRLFAAMLHRVPASRPSGTELVAMLRQVVIAESARHKDDDDVPTVVPPTDEPETLIDTIPDEVLHRVTAMAARLFSAPIAAVSLVEGTNRRLVSHFGENVEDHINDIDLSNSQPPAAESLFITDARKDPRSKDSRLVKGPLGMRFYAGAPLKLSDGTVIGTLSVINTSGYKPKADDMTSLEDLAALVVAQLEMPSEGLRSDQVF